MPMTGEGAHIAGCSVASRVGRVDSVDAAAERRLRLDALLKRGVPVIDVGPFTRMGR